MDIVGCIPKFFKTKGGWILTILSCIGVVGTAALAAKEAPEVDRELKEAEAEKSNEPDPNLTIGEKAEIIIPGYLPAILVGTVTIGCMIGAQIFNVKQQALLLGAYAMLGQKFDAYRKEVQKELGEEREKEIYLESDKKVKELQAQVNKLKEENAPQLYTMPWLPGVIFESTPEHMNKTFYHMLFNILNGGEISLFDLYEHIGLPRSCYNVDEAKDYGWDSYENEITYGGASVEFDFADVERYDGKIVHIITSGYVPPYKLGLDYGMTDNSTDYTYPRYDFERTMALATASIDDDVEKFDLPDMWIQHTW